MKKGKKRGLTIVIIALVLIAGVLAFIFINRANSTSVMSVPLSSVVKESLEEKISASGSFQADSYSVVSSKTNGVVKDVLVKPGDTVKKGDIIALVDEQDAREALTSAQIALEEISRSLYLEFSAMRSDIQRASLALDQAVRAAASAEKLREVDGLAEEDYKKVLEQQNSARLACRNAEDRLRVAQGLGSDKTPVLNAQKDDVFIKQTPSYKRALIAVEAAQRALEGCVIKAESAGVVTQIGASVGDRLTIQSIVAKIEDLSSIIAEVFVDEVDIGKIKEGMAAAVTTDSLLGTEIKGRVRRIWPSIMNEGGGRVCRVQVALIDAGSFPIRTGASCVTRIVSVLNSSCLIIPASSLIPGTSPYAVWIAVPDALSDAVSDAASTAVLDSSENKESESAVLYTLQRREIETGLSTVSSLEVLSGLEEGDVVVSDMTMMLSEGMKVLKENIGL
ncbi:MAG TPA: efflux RND transporter periplasmic adaptor subunit [Treponemataceae bacterium]|nr:efflux RND transporter periplasmic adaptor subunit [Treponemataceae bacterium]